MVHATPTSASYSFPHLWSFVVVLSYLFAASPMASPFPFVLPKFDNTIGALLISGFVSSALWGIMSVQTYLYYTGYGNDRRSLRLLIGFLWTLDSLHSCLTCHMLYFYLVDNYVNPLVLLSPVWSAMLLIPLAAVTTYIIRVAFVRRAYHLSGNSWILATAMMALSTVDLVTAFIITVKAFHIHTFTKLNELSSLLYLSFASGTSTDTLIAVTLCFYLAKARTGFERTNGLVNTLMLYALNTGLLVALDATTGLVLYICMPRNFIFMAFYFLLSKLYLNSYLAVLNARDRLRRLRSSTMSIHLSKLGSSPRYDTEMGTEPTSATSDKPSGTLSIERHGDDEPMSGVIVI